MNCKQILQKYFWILALVIFSLTKFIPFFTKGYVPVPFDLFLGGYYPWLSDKWGYLVGVQIKNPLLSDIVSQFYPWMSLMRDQVLSGRFPLWNPTSLMGYPFLANFQVGVFYPTSFILLLGKLPQMRTLQLIIQQLLGIFFMYLYLRSRKISSASSFIGAVIYNTAGHMSTNFEMSLGSRAVIWLPLALYLIDKFIKKRDYLLLLPIALCEISIITAGQIQNIVYLNLIILAVLLFEIRKNFKAVMFVAISLLIGIIITSPQLIPTAELFFNSVRLNDTRVQQNSYGILPWKHLITLFVGPDIFGNPSTGNYFGFFDYPEAVGYIGIISSLFVYLTFLNKGNRWLKIGFIVSILFTFSNPIAMIPYRFNIPLLNSSVASRGMYPINFFLTVLTVSGLESIYKRKYSVRQLLVPIIVILFVIVYFVSKNSVISLRNLVIPVILFIFGISGIIFASLRPKLIKAVIFILSILICLDLLRYHYKYNSYINPDLIFPITPTTQFLSEYPGRFITTTSEVLPSNSWTPYHLDSMFGYENLAPASIAGYFATMNTGTPTVSKSERFLNSVSNYESPLLDFAGVKYIVTLKRDKIRKIDPNGYLRDDSIDLTKFKPVFSDRAVVILEKQGISKYYINYDPIITEDDKDTLGKMLVNKEEMALFTSDKLSNTYGNTLKPEIVNLSQNISGDVFGSFTAKENGILNIAVTNYPGWIAKLDGKPTRILKTNFLFMGIEVTPGEHSLLLQYKPSSFYFGLLISGVSIIVLITSVVFLKIKN